MMKTRFAILAFAFGACMGAGCASDIGETCETSGSADECVNDAVCVQAVSGEEPTCRKVCADDSQCTSTESCNGVEKSNLKACRPK
jgi:hypothetical protein